jgi:hypothetical protein
MKKIIPLLTIMLMSMSLVVYGQKKTDEKVNEDPIVKILKKYEDSPGVESITISPALLEIMKGRKDNNKETQELFSKISELRVLTMAATDSSRHIVLKTFTAELQTVVKKDFKEYMKIKSAGERSELYVRDKPDCNDCSRALLFISSTAEYITVIYLAGTIDKTLIDAVMNGSISVF